MAKQEHEIPTRTTLTILALALAGGVYLHLIAGMYLPMPVVDEAVFYYMAQGINLKNALANNWANPHLNPARELFCMPPGYMLLLTGWMKLTGASLLKARWFSFLLAFIAYFLFVRLFRKWNLGLAGLVLLTVAFLSRHWVVTGNFVRMEGLELCLWALGLMSLQKGNKWAALSWFLFSVCVHPNGVYFCAMWLGIQVWEILALRKKNILFDPYFFKKIGHLTPGLLAVLAYAWHVFPHRAAFVADWIFQFGTRKPGGISLLLLRPDVAVFLVLWLGCAVLIYRNENRRQLALPLLTAAMLWLMRLLGQGWSYGLFNVLAVTITAAITLKLSMEIIPDIKSIKAWKKAVLTLNTMLIIMVLTVGKVYSVPGVWRMYEWQGMYPEESVASAYILKNDQVALRDRLHFVGKKVRKDSGRIAKIYTLPEAEGILLGSGESDSWLHALPYMPDKANPRPDYILWHKEEFGDIFESSKKDMATICDADTLTPFYQRLDKEGHAEATWYLVRLDGALPPFILRAFPEMDSPKNTP